MSQFAVILPAAGQSSRFRDNNYKKPFAPLDGRAVWLHSAERFLNRRDVKQVIIVVADEDLEEFGEKFGANLAILGIEAVKGGKTRADSVKRGLAKVKDDIDFVAVHDAARPVFTDAWIDEVFAAATKSGAAILATPVTSTLKRVSNKNIVETVDRTDLWQAQTPQVFGRQLLLDAHAQADADSATDDAELVQRLGHQVTIVPSSPLNLKITTREDLKMAGLAIKSLPKPNLGAPGNPLDDMWR